MSEPKPLSIVAMQQLIRPWLRKPNWSTNEFVNLLDRKGFPPLGYEEEPYVWLLRGFPDEEPALTDAKLTIAMRAAFLLDEKPDSIKRGRTPDQLLHNLLMLCSSVADPATLAEPLNRMLKRHQASNSLDGTWLGLRHTATFRNTLQLNQNDQRHRGLWQQMLKGHVSPTLPGHPINGFHGLCFMPGVTEADIGEAIQSVALCMPDNEGRAAAFYDLIGNAASALSVDRLNPALAEVHQWPEWAAALAT